MKKEIADLWIDALKSGKYKKDIFKLNINNETFCCLGVLCELAIANGIELEKIVDDDKSIDYDNNATHLPEKVQEWAGMRSNYGSFDSGKNNLVSLNDTSVNFNKVIRAILEHQEEL